MLRIVDKTEFSSKAASGTSCCILPNKHTRTPIDRQICILVHIYRRTSRQQGLMGCISCRQQCKGMPLYARVCVCDVYVRVSGECVQPLFQCTLYVYAVDSSNNTDANHLRILRSENIRSSSRFSEIITVISWWKKTRN